MQKQEIDYKVEVNYGTIHICITLEDFGNLKLILRHPYGQLLDIHILGEFASDMLDTQALTIQTRHVFDKMTFAMLTHILAYK